MTCGQSAPPAVASVPVTSNRTGRLNQPAVFGGRSGLAPVTTGPVASYLRPYGNAALRFPAVSVHLPASEAVALSGPLYMAAVQASMPAVWSVPSNVIETGRLYQPSTSAA